MGNKIKNSVIKRNFNVEVLVMLEVKTMQKKQQKKTNKLIFDHHHFNDCFLFWGLFQKNKLCQGRDGCYCINFCIDLINDSLNTQTLCLRIVIQCIT